MRIYYHIDELSRDAVVASALKFRASKRSWDVFFGNRSISADLAQAPFFDVIILPSLEMYKTYFPDSRRLPDHVFILPTEAVGQATKNLRRINAKYFGDNDLASRPWHQSVAGFLLWGFRHTKIFETYHSEYLSKVRVVGHPRFSQDCLPPRRSNPDKSVVTVGLVSKFGQLNPHNSTSNMSLVLNGMRDEADLQPTYENSPSIDIEDLLYTEAIDLRIYLTLMQRLASCSSVRFSIKPYPRENVYGWNTFLRKHNINATVCDWKTPFSAWLSTVDVIVSPPSTSFYDMIIQGRIPICTDRVYHKRAKHILTESDDNNQILEYVPRPDSIEELLSYIDGSKQPLLKDGYQNVLEEQTGASLATSSTENILNAIQTLMPSKQRCAGRRNIRYKVFATKHLLIANIKMLRDILSGRREQSSSFHMTAARIKWIKRLHASLE